MRRLKAMSKVWDPDPGEGYAGDEGAHCGAFGTHKKQAPYEYRSTTKGLLAKYHLANNLNEVCKKPSARTYCNFRIYCCIVFSSPRYSASEIRAWPIETSSRSGISWAK